MMSIFSIAHYLLSSFHGHRGLTESLYSGFRLTYVKGKINSLINVVVENGIEPLAESNRLIYNE